MNKIESLTKEQVYNNFIDSINEPVKYLASGKHPSIEKLILVIFIIFLIHYTFKKLTILLEIAKKIPRITLLYFWRELGPTKSVKIKK